VTPAQLAQMLAALPSKQSTLISIARMLGEFMISEGTGSDAFVEYRNLCELGGFDGTGPISVADIVARVGAGEYRVSAYGFEPRGRVGKCSCAWRMKHRDSSETKGGDQLVATRRKKSTKSTRALARPIVQAPLAQLPKGARGTRARCDRSTT
jgi:hypothetical protein